MHWGSLASGSVTALSDVCACVLFSGANHRHIETAEEKTSGAADKRCAAVVTYLSKVQFNAQDSKGGGGHYKTTRESLSTSTLLVSRGVSQNTRLPRGKRRLLFSGSGDSGKETGARGWEKQLGIGFEWLGTGFINKGLFSATSSLSF